ncbi:MAG: NB-ARC domain-containing protein [Spirosomataceae bacterium]
MVLGYGENYNDLTPFINALAHTVEHDDDFPKTLEGKPICLGQNRLDLVEKVADYLSKNYHKPIGILGTGGLGKTNLVLNVLHHRAIARKYRRNRFFVRCDGAKDLALLQNALINALEMPVSSGDLGDRILNYLSHQDNRFLIALDNFETAWQDKGKVEPFIERLKDHADLVFTYRGNASPDELDWKVLKCLF